mgnify:CR=1 FL=1
MGRNYAENSLKKFLKRKVKITMGVVVSFLITGAVAFGAEPQEPTINAEGAYIPYNKWLEGVERTKSLGNLLDKEIKIERYDNKVDKSITISKTNDKDLGDILVIGLKNSQEGTNKFEDINLGISLKYLSNDTFEYVKTSLNNIANSVSKGEVNESQQECKELLNILNSEIKDESKKYNGYYTAQLADKNEVENTGIIMKDTSYDEKTLNIGQTAINGGTVKNSGIIMTEGRIGQYARGENSKTYNYGLISNIDKETGTNTNTGYGNATGGAGQKAFNNAEVYNYGIIAKNFKSGQWADNNSKAYNYGLIFNERKFAQKAGEGSAVYNYGTLVSNLADHMSNPQLDQSDFGSDMQVSLGGDVYNYGMIHTDRKYAQIIRGNGGNLYNYGIIDSKTTFVMSINSPSQNNESNGYNYGIINGKSNGTSLMVTYKDANSYNYGLINDNGNSSVLSADTNANGINYGIIIANADGNILSKERTAYYALNYGIGLKREIDGTLKLHEQEIDEVGHSNTDINKDGKVENYNVNNDTYNLTTNKTITEIENDSSIKVANQKNNIFVNNLNKDSSVTLTVDKDTLDNKHITAVLGKESKSDTAVKSTGDLTLNNSTIIGYFEKDGTLLEVNGDLILSGNSVINAIAGNEYTGYKGNALNNVVAVKLSDNGTLTIGENSKVLGAVKGNGTLVYENIDDEFYSNTQEVDSAVIRTTDKNTTDITLANLTLKDSGTGVNNAGKLIIDNQSDKKLEGKEVSTTITLANNINIENGIDGSSSANGIELILGDGQTSSDNTISVDSITLGTESDILTINNALKEVGVIDGKDGDDIVNLKNLTGTYDTFDYQLKNIETLDLNNQTWKIGTKADISFDNGITKAGEKTTIQNGTLMGELKGTVKDGVDFVNNEAVNKVIGNSTFGDNAKFQIGIGKDMKLVAGGEYDITDTTVENLDKNVGADKITASAIFTKATEQGKDIRVKSAKEMNIDERYSGIYEEMLKNASSNSEILNVLNSTDVSSIANAINEKGALGDTLATTGYKITRDISNSFMSAVNEWGKKANKGEWLANAKYINSDVEYDGANKVKGYDSDIKSMVGMIEYGVSDNTSLGIALGGGDTEIDVKDAGTLKGDNYYIGAYAKHSVNGFDLTGNLGYTISDLEVNGKGSADSSAITLGGYIKRDIALTETVRLEPNLSFTYDYIMQDNAEGNGVKVDNKDVHVFEAGAGMNIVKEFNFEKGVLELEAGVKYSMADVNRNEETVISVYGIDDINLGNPEVDKTRGTAHVGFDYEHETGFGVNGKYEMMWSDSGDDSRLTAGISYRF